MIQQTGDTSSLSLPDNFIGPAKEVCELLKQPLSSVVLEENLIMEHDH